MEKECIFISADLLDKAISLLKANGYERHWRYEDHTGGYLTASVSDLVHIKLAI